MVNTLFLHEHDYVIEDPSSIGLVLNLLKMLDVATPEAYKQAKQYIYIYICIYIYILARTCACKCTEAKWNDSL